MPAPCALQKISNFKTAFVFELADDLLHPLIIAVQCLSARYDKLSFGAVFTKFLRQIVDWFGTPFAAWLRNCMKLPVTRFAQHFRAPSGHRFSTRRAFVGEYKSHQKSFMHFLSHTTHIQFYFIKNYSFCNSFSRICNVEYLFCSDSL